MKTKASKPVAKPTPVIHVAGGTAHVPQPEPEYGAMTQTQFCERYHIDRVTLYNLRKRGEAPDILLIGRKVLITYAAAREWERRMTERNAAPADATA